ncbi:MAG: hypothetical protein QM790_10505 [Nibricoccus sp.]
MQLNSSLLSSLAATGFTMAFFHAAIPTHWLPFVLVGRARAWSRSKVMAVTIAAGFGHVLLTSLLGLVVTVVGFKVYDRFGPYFPWVVGGILLAMAIYYFWRQWKGGGICHHSPPGGQHQPSEHCGQEDEQEHSHWDHELHESPLVVKEKGDWAAINGLFVMLTLSPCEGFLPVYLSAVKLGWPGYFLLSGILAVAALAAMTLLTWLTLVGLDRFRIKNFERYEAGLLGILFLILGVLVVVLEH